MKKRVFIQLFFLLNMLGVVFCEASQHKLWSILICTLDERVESFERIYNKLHNQIEENGLIEEVEILFFRDNREYSIGFKRNALLQSSKAEYICFVDDDDDVHEHYIPMIYEKLLEKPDCVSLVGIMTTNGQNPEIFIHSIEHNDQYGYENGAYLRPPNHLNPMKRSIASRFLFSEVNVGEDKSWCCGVARSGLLQNEAVIDEPYYFYQYDGKYHVQAVVQTEELIEQQKPRVTIMTSVYKGDEFIAGFMEDIVRQTIFDECELIIINAASPGNEGPIIQDYVARYPNISYERLESDPGVYGVWNYILKKAHADLVTFANIDDRRNPESLEMHARALEEDDSVDLVYSDFYLTRGANETFENNNRCWLVQVSEFAPELMYKCLPGPQPMWRTSLHDEHGYFDETFFSAGDFELWNRLASHGVRFKKVAGISGLYYENPTGLSTDQNEERVARRKAEDARIVEEYQHCWSW